VRSSALFGSELQLLLYSVTHELSHQQLRKRVSPPYLKATYVSEIDWFTDNCSAYASIRMRW
jgi:hypothetical protein